MKFLSFTITVCFVLTLATASAQEISADSFLGKWDYKSPKGKMTCTYQFLLEKGFMFTTEHKGVETKINGVYDTDKKGEIDRLIVTTNTEGDKTRSQIQYYFIKFTNPDTVKLQIVTDKQEKWRPETKKNTLVLIKKKEKPKKDEQSD